MKIYVMTDMEGVAGVSSFATDVAPPGMFYERSRKFLTGELNACIGGALAGGAKEVVVIDGHGAGGINIEDLHKEAKLLHGRTWPYPLFGLDKTFDGVIFVGTHSMSGTADGNLNHTQSHESIDWIKFNGREIGEIGQFAIPAGAIGVPTIFVSGDRAACREARELLGDVEIAEVKEGINQDLALTLTPEKARELIRKYSEIAMRRIKEFKPIKFPPPYEITTRFNLSTHAYARSQRPDVELLDSKTVRVKGNDILDVFTRSY